MGNSSIKIRFYGESFKIYNLKLESNYEEAFYKTAKKLRQPIETALLDIRFFELLGIESYKSIQDLIVLTHGGLIHNPKNRIEIKKGRKRLQAFSIRNLIVQETLFPLFNVKKESQKLQFNNELVLIEKEVGMTGEYHINSNQLNIEELCFKICDLEAFNSTIQVLSTINYKDTQLESLKSDTLITYRHCINNLIQKS